MRTPEELRNQIAGLEGYLEVLRQDLAAAEEPQKLNVPAEPDGLYLIYQVDGTAHVFQHAHDYSCWWKGEHAFTWPQIYDFLQANGVAVIGIVKDVEERWL